VRTSQSLNFHLFYGFTYPFGGAWLGLPKEDFGGWLREDCLASSP
jgi:hypothetical protein